MSAEASLLPDRSLIEVSGKDRISFLQGLVTNDMEGLAESVARFAGLLTPQGKILFDFFVIDLGEKLLLDCAVSIAADLVRRLNFYKLRANVAIAAPSSDLRVAAAWSEDAAAGPHPGALVAYSDPRLSALGTRLVLPGKSAQCPLSSFADYEAMRIALAVPEGGKDYRYGDAFPHEACFDFLHGVSFRKGCYIGQEVVSRMQHRGTARTRVLAVVADAPLPEGGVEILAEGHPVGRLGSVSGRQGIALARLDRVQTALAKGARPTAGGVPLVLSVPGWATYSLETEVDH